MSRDVLSVAQDEALSEAAARMNARQVGAIVVLDKGRLAGILTERDILRAVAERRAEGAKVDDFMTTDPETIEPAESNEMAATLMIHGGFRHLPVVEKGRVVGIVSIRDLIRVVLHDAAPKGV